MIDVTTLSEKKKPKKKAKKVHFKKLPPGSFEKKTRFRGESGRRLT